MTQEENNLSFTEEQIDFVRGLFDKAVIINQSTKDHANCVLLFKEGLSAGTAGVQIRVDDIKLLYIGARLLPNMLNYLVNILPQFLYPYIVAYLQELSTEERTLTVNDIYDIIHDIELDN